MGLVYQVYCELVGLGSQFPVLKHKWFHIIINLQIIAPKFL